MRLSTTTILITLSTLALAKDCAYFFSKTASNAAGSNGLESGGINDLCENDIGGEPEGPNSNGGVNFCVVCRNARSGTKDYKIAKYVDNIGVNYGEVNLKCGYYGAGKCSA